MILLYCDSGACVLLEWLLQDDLLRLCHQSYMLEYLSWLQLLLRQGRLLWLGLL